MEKREYREICILIGTTAAVYLGFKYLLPLVAPFLFSWLIAWILLPAVTFLKKRLHISKGIGGTLLIAMLIGILGLLVIGLGRLGLYQLGKLARDFPVYEQLFKTQAAGFCGYCDELFSLEKGECHRLMELGMEQAGGVVRARLLPELSRQTVFGVGKLFSTLWILFLVFLGVFLIVRDSDDLKVIWEESVWYQKGRGVLAKLSKTGLAYGKAQLIIMGFTILVCGIGIFLTGNPYSLLIGVVIAVLDALPAIGSGLILIPWSIIKVFKGRLFHGAVLLSCYVICQVLRQLIESKIIGDRIGIKPIFTIIAMYAGLKLFGILGFILGPAALIIIKTSLQSLW